MVDRFTDVKQIKECAKYYIELLGLQDWRIVYSLTDDFRENWAGMNESDYICKTAKISIRKSMPEDNDMWVKQPHEEVLIHELLHCKFINVSSDTVEGTMFEQVYHTLLDDMARAIIKARYNLTNDYYYFE